MKKPDKGSDELLSECDKEPIHLLGKIQSHGILLAFHKITQKLAYASENATDYLKDIRLNSNCVLNDIFDDDVAKSFKKLSNQNFYSILYDNEVTIDGQNYLLFFSNSNDYIVIELERQLNTSTSFESFNTFKTISQNIKDCLTKDNLINTTTHFLKAFTGFDRIMIYQFDEHGDGEVIAEEKSIGLDSFLGLKYPASDIPKQARKLYLTNLSRAIHEINDEGIPVNCFEEKQLPIDLSYSAYRSVSPVHIQYLKNMGVTATHVVSIIIDNKLWGMLICHHYSGPKALNFNSRFLLELIANQFSNKIMLLDTEHLRKYEEIQNDILHSINMHEEYRDFDLLLREHWFEITKQIDTCGFTIFNESNSTKHYGATPKEGDVLKIYKVAEKRALDKEVPPIFYYSSITTVIDDWESEQIAGCACLAILPEAGKYIYFWRNAKEQVINWAGNPEKAMTIEEKNDRVVLTPRASFDIWVQKEKGKALPWLPEQKHFIKKLYEQLKTKEIRFFNTVFEENTKLTSSGKKLKKLLENKSEELSILNQQLQKQLKSNSHYQKELEIAIKTGEEINQLKSKIFSNLSHEIRTPITSIIGISNIFLMEKQLNANHRNLINLTLKNAYRLLGTVDKVLQTSKIDNEKSHFLIEYTEIVELTTCTIEILKQQADEKNINLVFINQVKELYAYTDQLFYSQIVSGLVSNAIKFTNKNGRVEVNLKLFRKNGINNIYLSVEDSGIGIKESEIHKIFKPYYTVKSSTFQADKSTGLGLYIVKNNLSLLNGQIEVESEKGKGSIFKVLIPSKDE